MSVTVSGATDLFPDDSPSLPEVSLRNKPSKEWELDVRGLVSTQKWLENYGLKKGRLDLHSLIPILGFKHIEDYDFGLKKPVSSKYGEGLFHRIFRASDGKHFNLTCNRDKLKQIEFRLLQAITLFKRRLEWLTTESRRIFGVIEESNIIIILDISTISPVQFDHYRCALERVLREQVTQKSKFNLVRMAEDVESFEVKSLPVTADNIQLSIDWLWNLERLSPSSLTSTVEAVNFALKDKMDAIYLFTEGTSCAGAREILQERVKNLTEGVSFHVISYNCTDAYHLKFLRHLSTVVPTPSKFHAYGIVLEMDMLEPNSDMSTITTAKRAGIIARRQGYGGMPAGAGVRDDVIRMFEELEEARNVLAQVQAFLEADAKSLTFASIPHSETINNAIGEDKETNKERSNLRREEQYLSSKEWLARYGLKVRKLGIYDCLSSAAFKHCDGVVRVQTKPPNPNFTTDATGFNQLINAKYCSNFAHIRWKDGGQMHVHVTPELYRIYESKMKTCLESIQQRINWLKHGSRELFGTILENQVYFLIDTSASMIPHIEFVKDKLYEVMHEQIRHKTRFNFIAFNTRVESWQERMEIVDYDTLSKAWTWIQNLSCQGSTNTLGALTLALSDPKLEAVYLLTDGRPNQPINSILSQVQLRDRIPIHTISFNCDDKEANQFLYDLAQQSGGRFHYYNTSGTDMDSNAIVPFESEDLTLLRRELEIGLKHLSEMHRLRNECARLAWKKTNSLSSSVEGPLYRTKQGQTDILSKSFSHMGSTLSLTEQIKNWDTSLNNGNSSRVRHGKSPRIPASQLTHSFSDVSFSKHNKSRLMTGANSSFTDPKTLIASIPPSVRLARQTRTSRMRAHNSIDPLSISLTEDYSSNVGINGYSSVPVLKKTSRFIHKEWNKYKGERNAREHKSTKKISKKKRNKAKSPKKLREVASADKEVLVSPKDFENLETASAASLKRNREKTNDDVFDELSADEGNRSVSFIEDGKIKESETKSRSGSSSSSSSSLSRTESLSIDS